MYGVRESLLERRGCDRRAHRLEPVPPAPPAAYYYRKTGLHVTTVRDFLNLLRATRDERARIILANLHTKLDALPRYSPDVLTEDDIPF